MDKAPILMNRVLNPHAIPTSRKPTIHLQVGGGTSGCMDVVETIFS